MIFIFTDNQKILNQKKLAKQSLKQLTDLQVYKDYGMAGILGLYSIQKHVGVGGIQGRNPKEEMVIICL